jgi:hypothetical protein
MGMYNLRQIPSERQKYLRVAVFGSDKLFCSACRHSNPVVYEERHRWRRCRFNPFKTLTSVKLPI